MPNNSDDLIHKHYQQQAEKDGESPLSTIGERVVREKELAMIGDFLALLQRKSPNPSARVLDVGCGNGYTLGVLRERFPALQLNGLEFTEELLAIARNRKIAGCTIEPGDIRKTHYADNSFDAVYSERCLINILDPEGQKTALREIARILKPSGYYLMIEGFTEGLDLNNKARREMGLEDIAPAYHNLYFDAAKLFPEIDGALRVVKAADIVPEAGPDSLPSNFLSSHFFVARILQPLLTRGDWVRNSEFVKFFSYLPPMGDYGPIKAYILQKTK